MLSASDRGSGCAGGSRGRQSAAIMANPKDPEPRTPPPAEDEQQQKDDDED
jgi:hypothetical protein